MNIFGLEPIQATIVISVIGVFLQVGLGVLQSNNPFDGKKLLASSIIAVFAAFAIVMPVIEGLPDDASDLLVFSAVTGLIAGIAGIDQMVKNAGNSLLSKARKQKQ